MHSPTTPHPPTPKLLRPSLALQDDILPELSLSPPPRRPSKQLAFSETRAHDDALGKLDEVNDDTAHDDPLGKLDEVNESTVHDDALGKLDEVNESTAHDALGKLDDHTAHDDALGKLVEVNENTALDDALGKLDDRTAYDALAKSDKVNENTDMPSHEPSTPPKSLTPDTMPLSHQTSLISFGIATV